MVILGRHARRKLDPRQAKTPQLPRAGTGLQGRNTFQACRHGSHVWEDVTVFAEQATTLYEAPEGGRGTSLNADEKYLKNNKLWRPPPQIRHCPPPPIASHAWQGPECP